MYFVKKVSYENFGKMFFQISAKLTDRGKKMSYTDWKNLRDLAIKVRCCKIKSCENDTEMTTSSKKDLVIDISDVRVEISCYHCGNILEAVEHKETAEEIIKYYGNKIESTDVVKEALIGNLTANVIGADSLSDTKLNLFSGPTLNNSSNNEVSIDNLSEKCYNNNIINNKNIKGEEENDNMMNTNKMLKGLDFGKADTKKFRLSHLGLAIQNREGVFVSYDKTNEQLVDVDLFDFDLDGMIYKMPVAHNQVVPGDIIMHNGKPVLVADSTKDNLDVIDPVAGEVKTIMPTKNMFGFNFFTKILCLMDMNNSGASTDNPFGNMMPMMMMSAMSEGSRNNDMMTMMMMSQMMGGNSQMEGIFSNPMMMMAMMSGDGKMGDTLPMMMMMMQGPHNHTGSCGGNCTCNK